MFSPSPLSQQLENQYSTFPATHATPHTKTSMKLTRKTQDFYLRNFVQNAADYISVFRDAL